MRRKQQAQEHVKSPERLPRDPPARISLAFPPQGSLGMESLFSVALRGRSENVALTVRSPFLVFTFRPEMESQADKVCPRSAPTSCSLRKEEAASVYLVTSGPTKPVHLHSRACTRPLFTSLGRRVTLTNRRPQLVSLPMPRFSRLYVGQLCSVRTITGPEGGWALQAASSERQRGLAVPLSLLESLE